MATSTYTEDLGVSSLNEFINGLTYKRSLSRMKKRRPQRCCLIMEWFGWIWRTRVYGLCEPAALLAGASLFTS